MKWFRRLFERPDSTLIWHVEFDEGGRTYTYRRTEEQFRQEMEERYLIRGDFPYRVRVARGGKIVEVRLEAE